MKISAVEVNVYLQMSFNVFFYVAACYSFYRTTYCTDHTYSFCYEISHVELLSKHFWQTLRWYFPIFLVFLWPTRDCWVLKIFSHFCQSKLLPQNFTCSFLLLRFLNNWLNWSQGSIFFIFSFRIVLLQETIGQR